MTTVFAPPNGRIITPDSGPFWIQLSIDPPRELNATGRAAINSHITSYLTATKISAIWSEANAKYGGYNVDMTGKRWDAVVLPASQVNNVGAWWPVLSTDIATEVTFLQGVVASAANFT